MRAFLRAIFLSCVRLRACRFLNMRCVLTSGHASRSASKMFRIVTDLVTNPQGRRGGGIPRNDSNSGLTTGISLQVKQWKTIHEFESDEQQKYLVFASLKCRSIRIFYLMLISLLLMAVDLSLTSQATITSKSNVQRFVQEN